MAVSASNLEIEIDGECYALNKVPAENSAVVLAERDRLLGAIDLKALVDDLGRVGGFICLAYNGVGAAGPEYTENQIQIQRLGYDITKLCDKSALTVAKFKKASSSVLTDLQSTYDYLIDNLEEMAIDTLSAVSKLAGDMQKAALELKEEFEEEARKVILTVEDTQRARKKADEDIKKQEDLRHKLEAEQKQEMQLMQEHQEREREAEITRRNLEQQEDRAISEIGEVNPLKEIANAITSSIPLIGKKVFSTDGAEKKAEALRKKRLEALETERAIRKQRHDALARMTDFTAKIARSVQDKNMAECAVEALHEAAGALKHLSAVMMQAALFWEQMQNHCRSLAESEMKSQVEKALKYSEDKRLKVWTSSGFKRKAVEFYAGWVALNGVCNIYMEQIKLTQKDLYRYISENPTWKESQDNLPQLAQNFLSNLKEEQKKLSDKDFEAQEKMKALEHKDQQE